MRRNRLILILFIILSGVYVSVAGGYVAYGLFYLSLFLPIMSLIYLRYVYVRFRVYQIIEHKTVIKGEHIPYQFILANEDIIAYTNVRVSFKSDCSIVEKLQADASYCLLPKDRIEQMTTIVCLYRGEYLVGAEDVYVNDFLHLFEFQYPAPSPITVRVLPRIVRLKQLVIVSEQEGKNLKFNPAVIQNVPDIEIRNYVQGDSLKMIHWKSAAKQQKLMTRKYTDEPKTEVVVYLDLTKKKDTELQCIILEDKIIESALSICDYFYRSSTPIKVLYETASMHLINIVSKTEFDGFYQVCTDVNFHAKSSMAQLFEKAKLVIKNQTFNIAITHTVTDELIKASYQLINDGNTVVIVFIGDEVPQQVSDHLDERVMFLQIRLSQEINEVLEG